MTKQEEIRVGTDVAFKHFAELIRSKPKKLDAELVTNMRKEYLDYLHSQGVVIKVEREFPKLVSLTGEASLPEKAAYLLGTKDAKEQYIKAGFEAVEPLLEMKHDTTESR